MAENTVQIVITARSDGAVSQIRLADDQLKTLGGTVRNTEKSFLSMKNAVAVGGAALAGWGAASLAGSFLETAASFEQLQVSLVTLTGSSDKAREATNWITEFTAATPYQLNEVSEAFIRLTAYGLEPAETLRMLGDTASAMGKSLMDASEMYADAVMGEFERLKEFGIRASQEKDKVTFHYSVAGRDMVMSTEKTQEGVSNALSRIFERFRGGMADQSHTWKGVMSNMSDSWTLFKKEVMDSEGLFSIAKTGACELHGWIVQLKEDGSLKSWASDIAAAVVSAFQYMVKAGFGFYLVLQEIKAAWTGLQISFKEQKLKELQDAARNKSLGPSLFGIPGTEGMGNFMGLTDLNVNSLKGMEENFKEQEKLRKELEGPEGLRNSLENIRLKQESACDSMDDLLARTEKIRTSAMNAAGPIQAAAEAVRTLDRAAGSLDDTGGRQSKKPLDFGLAVQTLERLADHLSNMKKDVLELGAELETTLARSAGEGLLAEEIAIDRWFSNIRAKAFDGIRQAQEQYRGLAETIAETGSSGPQAAKILDNARNALEQAWRTGLEQIELAGRLAEAKGRAAQDQAVERTVRLELENARLTGTLEDQLQIQAALLDAEKQRSVAAADNREQQDLIRQIYEEQARRLRLRASGGFFEGFSHGFDQWQKELPTAFDRGVSAFETLKNCIDNAAGALAEFTLTGKMDFADFADSIIRDIVRMQYQAMLSGMLSGSGGSGFLNLIGTALGGLFSGSSGGMGYDAALGKWGYGVVPYHHSGGIAGQASDRYGLVDMGIFQNAPRLHNGLAPDEFPAVLQAGERVLSRKQTRDLARPMNVVIHIENQTGFPITAEQTSSRMDPENYIVGLVVRNIHRGGDIYKTIRGLK